MVDDCDLFSWYLILKKYLPDKMVIVPPYLASSWLHELEKLVLAKHTLFLKLCEGGGMRDSCNALRRVLRVTMVTPASSDNLLITIKSRSLFVFTP